MIGQTLGRYRVLEQIGAGGMGLVFRAHDERLGRDVALKVLPPGTITDESARRRFRKEALTLSKLNHPNIETVFDFDTEDGVDFLVMELIPGVTLDEKLAAGALPEKEVVRLGMQLAEGLAAAHAEEVIHRDLKPGNLRLTPDGRLKILDFGLAKLLRPVSDSAPTESLSQTHGAVGTPPYMSPEQLRGKLADPRSDLWAAGAVLYELATGRRAFAQSSAPMLTDAILRQAPVAPRALNPALSAELERIVSKALEKDPEHRYQSAADLAADLKRLHQGMWGAAPPSESPAAAGRRLRLRAAGFLVLIAIGGYAAFSLLRSRPPAFERFTIEKLAGNGSTVADDISRDGKYLLNIARDKHGAQSVWIRNLGSKSDTQVIAEAPGVSYAALSFSPDGNHIYVTRREGQDPVLSLYRLPLFGGALTRVVRDIDTKISFAPDGQSFAYAVGNNPEPGKYRLVISSADGAQQRTLLTKPMPMPMSVAWSPDGKHIVCSWPPAAPNGELTVVDVATRDEQSLFPSQSWSIARAAWLPDGNGLIVLAGNGSNGQQIGYVGVRDRQLRRITNDTSNYAGLALSGDGGVLLTNAGTYIADIYLADPDGSRIRQLTAREPIESFAWSPNGRLVTGVGGALTLIDPASGARSTLLSDQHRKVIAAKACRDGVFVFSGWAGESGLMLWVFDRNGVRQLTNGERDVVQACSPDARWAYFYRRRGNEDIVMRVPLTGGEPVAVSNLPKASDTVDLSPDGRLIALGTLPPGGQRKAVLALVDVEGRVAPRWLAPRQNLSGALIRFTPDGKAVAFTHHEATADNVWAQPLDGSPAKQLTHFPAEFIREFAWSPDGRQLALSRGHWDFDIVLLRDRKGP